LVVRHFALGARKGGELMTLRTGHGNGAGTPHIEVLPADELPAPVPPESEPVAEPAEPADTLPVARRLDGTYADKEGAKLAGSLAGKRSWAVRCAKREAKVVEEAERARQQAARALLCTALGLATLDASAEFAPYRAAGDAWVAEHLVELAGQAGGVVGPGASSIIASAGVQLAASRFWSDRAAATCDPALFALASSLANASRQNLLASYELAVRAAKAKLGRQANGLPPGYILVDDDGKEIG
jgi:hypothetical protein